MSGVNKLSLMFVFLLVFLPVLKLSAQPPLERGDKGRDMKQEGPLSAEVTEVRSDEVVLYLSGRTQVIKVSPSMKLTREITKSLGDINIGTKVFILGQHDNGEKLRAMLIRIISNDQPSGMSAGSGGKEGPVTGTVKQVNPLIISTQDGNVEVDTNNAKKIIEEVTASFNEIKVGSRIQLIGPPQNIFKIVILEERPHDMGLKDRERPTPKGPESKRTLPEAPVVKVSLFNKKLMDNTKDSPFGFKDPNMMRIDLFSWYEDYGIRMNDLGVHWMEPAASFGFSWDQVQKKAPSGYTPFNWNRYDRLVKNVQSYNIHISGIINAVEPKELERRRPRPPSLPVDLNGYQDFVKALVERYDGDGTDDVPGLLYPIKFWKIEDEAMAKIYFNGTGSDYARLVNVAYEAVKSADKDSIVILSMIRGYDGYTEVDPKAFMEDFFKEFSKLSSLRKWDIMDQHWMILNKNIAPQKQYLEIKKYLDDVSSASLRYGFKPAPFWAMEVAGINEPEEAHAIDLFKRYVYAFSVGVRKVFWSGLAEKPSHTAPEFDDPLEKATLIDGYGHKKIAYYTYKNMVSALDGFEPGTVKTLKADGTYIFKFMRSGNPVWVAWKDGEGAGKGRFEAPQGVKKIKVTEALPDSEKRIDMKNDASFRSYGVQVINNSFEIEIGNIPIIITVE